MDLQWCTAEPVLSVSDHQALRSSIFQPLQILIVRNVSLKACSACLNACDCVCVTVQGVSGQVKERMEMVAAGKAPKDTRPLLLFPEVQHTAQAACRLH